MRCFGWLVGLLEISSKTANDIVENNDQVILPGFESETIWVIGTHYNEYNKKSWQYQIIFFFNYIELKYPYWMEFVNWKFTYRTTVYLQLL